MFLKKNKIKSGCDKKALNEKGKKKSSIKEALKRNDLKKEDTIP